MFELITTYYKTSELLREKENINCLINNLNNPLISKVHLFLQSHDYPSLDYNEKLVIINHYDRPKFSELFSYCNLLEPETIKIVANSDIYFDDTLKYVEISLRKLDILALTRWDLLKNGRIKFYNNYKSQDTWIFKRTINESIGDYHIGRHGCDNKLIYEFRKLGYKLGNPSYCIKSIHLHQSELRSYFNDPNYEFVSPPYGYLLPTEIYNKDCNEDKLQFYSVRYQYYKSLSNDTLPGVKYHFIYRVFSLIFSKYFAFKINQLR